MREGCTDDGRSACPRSKPGSFTPQQRPRELLVEFLGTHDYAWVRPAQARPFKLDRPLMAPDGPTVAVDEYHEAANRLTG